MVDQPQISPQGFSGVGGGVPTLRRDAVQAPNLTGIPRVAPTGYQAGEQAYAAIAQDAERMRNRLAHTYQNIRAEQEAGRRKREEMANRELEAQAEIMQQNIEMGFAAEVDTGLAGHLDTVAASTDDPAEIAARHQAVVQESTRGMPAPLATLVSDTAGVRAAPVIEAKQNALVSRQQAEAAENIRISQEQAEAEALKYSRPATDKQELAGAVATQRFNDLVDARTDITPAEKTLLKRKLMFNIQSGYALRAVAESRNPATTALKIVTGTHEDQSLNAIPADEKMRLLGYAQQIISVQDSLQNRAKEAASEARAGARLNLRKQLYDAVEAGDDALAERIQDQLFVTAAKDGELDEVISMRGYIDNKKDERWNKSDPETLYTLEYLIATKDIMPNEAQDFAFNLIGKGVSVADGTRLAQEAQRTKDTLVESPAYDTLMLEAEGIFPEAFAGKKRQDLGALLAAASGGGLDSLNMTDDEEKQTRLLRQFTIEVREAALSGEIANQEQLLEAGRKKLSAYRQQVQNQPAPAPKAISDVRKLDHSVLTPKQQAAWRKHAKDERLVKLANEKYLKNPALLVEDFKGRRINESDARKIQLLIMPKTMVKDE